MIYSFNKFFYFILFLSGFFGSCSSAPKSEKLILDQNEVLQSLSSEDCKFEKNESLETPEKMFHSFITKESVGLFQSDKMNWIFERQICPGKEHISDFIHVVTKRTVKLLKNEEDLKLYEVTYESKGIIILSDELRWDNRPSIVKRWVPLYKTSFGWKMGGPLFKNGEFLTPESVLSLYTRRISESFKKQLLSWVK